MTDMPASWLAATFDDVMLSIGNGANVQQNKQGTGVPVTRIETIARGEIDLERVGYADLKQLPDHFKLDDGDILFSHINSDKHLGKTAIFKARYGKVYHGVNLLRIKLIADLIAPEFFNFQCGHLRNKGLFVLNAQHAVNQSSLNQGRIKSLPVLLPPLPEQRRIVAKIDSLSAKSKRTRDQLDHIPRLVEKYKQAILTAAFRGDLTREWRSVGGPETVAHKLATSPTDKQKRRRKTIEGFTNRIGIEFYELPAGWHYKSIGSLLNEGALIDFADGNHGSNYPRKQEFGDEGAVFVTAAQIRNGRVYFDECALLNWDKARRLRKGWARTGDVLLTHNATVGRVAIVEDAIDPFLLGTSVTYYRADQSLLLNRFLFWVFCSPIVQDQLRAIMGQTTRNQVPITRQAYIELPIAPAAEQQEIVRRIDMALRWVDRLASETTSASKLIDHLDQAVLAKAFRGELVPQDPNDEPASVLLERIRAERQATEQGDRTAQGKASKTRRRAMRNKRE